MSNNKRQILRGDDFMNNKNICDLTYAKLQIESNWNNGEDHRYIYKNKINYSEWARQLGISRQTLKKRIDYLKKAGFIKEQKEVYLLEKRIDKVIYIPEETLRTLTNCMKKDTIKVYAYLGGWFKWKKKNKQGKYNFTRYSLIQEIGLKKGKTTLDKINDILLVLNKLGLIKTIEKDIIINGTRTTHIVLEDWKDHL